MGAPTFCSIRRRAVPTVALFLLVIIGVFTAMAHSPDSTEITTSTSNFNGTLWFQRRKLMTQEGEMEPNRIWSEKCSKSDIVISQGSSAPLPNGIPTYTVEIMNICTTGCNVGGIHLRCGWFSSARLINPHVFKRLRFNDCLVNDGKPLLNGRTLSFQYANTFRYKLDVAAVTC